MKNTIAISRISARFSRVPGAFAPLKSRGGVKSLNRAVFCAFPALFAALFAAVFAVQNAAAWGATALDNTSGNLYVSANYPTEQQARDAAIAACTREEGRACDTTAAADSSVGFFRNFQNQVFVWDKGGRSGQRGYGNDFNAALDDVRDPARLNTDRAGALAALMGADDRLCGDGTVHEGAGGITPANLQNCDAVFVPVTINVEVIAGQILGGNGLSAATAFELSVFNSADAVARLDAEGGSGSGYTFAVDGTSTDFVITDHANSGFIESRRRLSVGVGAAAVTVVASDDASPANTGTLTVFFQYQCVPDTSPNPTTGACECNTPLTHFLNTGDQRCLPLAARHCDGTTRGRYFDPATDTMQSCVNECGGITATPINPSAAMI